MNIREISEIKDMLAEATSRRNQWYKYFNDNTLSVKENAEALRNWSALNGVVKTLEWILKRTNNPLW